MIKISDIRVRHIKSDNNKLLAVASLIIDECFAIHDIKILSGDNGPFIAMPSRKTPDGEFKDIVHPINSETRDILSKSIIEAYNNTPKE